MSLMPDSNRFHSTLKEVTRAYGYAWNDYEQAMQRGDVNKADAALTRMQEIEQGVTVIVRPGARL